MFANAAILVAKSQLENSLRYSLPSAENCQLDGKFAIVFEQVNISLNERFVDCQETVGMYYMCIILRMLMSVHFTNTITCIDHSFDGSERFSSNCNYSVCFC